MEGALLLSSGRLAFDYLTLLCAIRATGVRPNPSLVLLAYAVAGLLALIPITPGGLGIVEAGLSAMLILAGIPSGQAVLATLAYRIISYWLPAAAGRWPTSCSACATDRVATVGSGGLRLASQRTASPGGVARCSGTLHGWTQPAVAAG